jgi:predicted small lipoprotein YifL
MIGASRVAGMLLLALLLGGACGRAGPPVRTPRAQAAPVVQAPEPAADASEETEEEKEEEPK